MGRLQAEEMKTLLDLDSALHWHLQYNHYPPIHTSFIPFLALFRNNYPIYLISCYF